MTANGYVIIIFLVFFHFPCSYSKNPHTVTQNFQDQAEQALIF